MVTVFEVWPGKNAKGLLLKTADEGLDGKK